MMDFTALYDQLQMNRKFARYWSSQQRQRYSQHHAWLHRLHPINAEIWAIKQLAKLREPNRYLIYRAERGIVNSRDSHANPDCFTCHYLVGKGHLANIYGKLSVNSRKDAVAQARALGLLPPR